MPLSRLKERPIYQWNTTPRWLTLLLWLAVVLASCVFTFRGPLRASSSYGNDFAAPYVSARLWLQHQNPYDPAAFLPEWHRAGASPGPVNANPSSTHSVYPPPSIVALLPLSLLTWPVASKLLVFISVSFYLTAIVMLSTLVPGTWREPLKPLFIIYGLLFAPAHSALHVTNVACISASFLFIALYLLLDTKSKGNKLRSGSSYKESSHRWPSRFVTNLKLDFDTRIIIVCLLSLSLCIKPTLAPLVLIYLLWARFFRILAATIVAVTVLCTVSIYPLVKSNSAWFASLQSNLHFIFFNGTADLALRNLTRFDRIDLQLPAYLITGSRTAALTIALFISVILIVLWLSAGLRRMNSVTSAVTYPAAFQPNSCASADLDEHLLHLSSLLTIGLLPTYQRYYSAVLLLIPVLWAFRNLKTTQARWLLALCSVFLVNTSVIPKMLGLINNLSHPVRDTLIGAHVCWILLLIAMFQIWILRSLNREK